MLTCTEGQKPLTRTEQQVISFLNSHASTVMDLTITDVAEQAFVSVSTVSRAVRKCGFPTFNAARYHLARRSDEDAGRYCLNDILTKSYEECTRTIENIDVEVIKQVAAQIRSARRVVLLARGLTGLVAEEFRFQLECLKLCVTVLTDGEIMKKMEHYLADGDLVFILTVQNSTPELAIAAKTAHRCGCKVITCCCRTDTPLEDISDWTIHGFSFEISPNRHLGSTSRIPLFLVTRTIVEYLGILSEPAK